MYSAAISRNPNLQPSFLPSPSQTYSWGTRIPERRHPPSPPRQKTSFPAWSAGGLRTPPSDDMGTAYQVPNLASYDSRPLHYSYSVPQAGRPAFVDPLFSSSPARAPYLHQLPPQPQTSQSYRPTAASSLSLSQPAASRANTRPSSPISSRTMSAASTSTTAVDSGNSGGALSERDAAMVVHSLQIPKCISPSGGNLSGFAAEVTALFWFESTKIIETAEQMDSLSAGTPVWPLSKNAVASAHFRKWVHTVLSTTQVTQNVILLALLFIYRLKIKNPSVNGRPGSEYRLLTVALMLGNKFLDDNTYTNKTWADVSGISVTEIHVMEVEFLSNMRYSLLASKEHWEDWLAKLARFKQYIDRAQLPPKSVSPTPSPTHRQFVSPLPSPTGNGPTLHPTPQSFHCNPYSPMSAAQTGNGSSQRLAVSHVMNNAVSPSPLALRPVEYGGNARKRGYPEEDPGDTTPAKRVNYGAQSGYFTQRQQPTQAQPPPQPVPAAQLGMLPQHQAIQQQVQHHMAAQQPRPIPAPKHQHHQPHQHQPHAPPRLSVPNLTINTNTYAPQQASALSLPPLVPGTRAMSTVYAYPGSSPIEAATAAYSHHAAAASGVHTPIAHSPSVYLQQRPSPYKPVRYVNTLLHPPPSAFLQQYHLCGGGAAPVPPANMHYQPLGRRNDVRTGVVPEFIVGPPPHQQQQQQYRGVPQQQQQPPQTTRPPMHPQPRPMPMQQPHYQGSY